MDRILEQHAWAWETGTPKIIGKNVLRYLSLQEDTISSILHLLAFKDFFRLGKEKSSPSITEMIENFKHGQRENSEVVLTTKKKKVHFLNNFSFLCSLCWKDEVDKLSFWLSLFENKERTYD